MKRTLSLLLILLSILTGLPVLAEAQAPTLTFTQESLTMLDKFSLKAKDFVAMSDGSALPKDLKFTTSDPKTATAVKSTGVVKAKKPGTVTLTVESKKLGQSAQCVITVKENVFVETRDVETLKKIHDEDDGPSVYAYERKIYFNNKGKLTVDLMFYNQTGEEVKLIDDFRMTLWDTAADKKISVYTKGKVFSKKVLAAGETLAFTYSFPKGGLASKIDLTKLDEYGLPAQIEIMGSFGYLAE